MKLSNFEIRSFDNILASIQGYIRIITYEELFEPSIGYIEVSGRIDTVGLIFQSQALGTV